MHKRICLVGIYLCIFAISYSQVGIGTKTPDSLAALHIVAKDKGLIIPSVSTFQEISSKLFEYTITDKENVKGILVFNEDDDKFYYWANDTTWICLNPLVGKIGIDTDLKTHEYDLDLELASPYQTLTGELRGNFEGTAKLSGIINADTNTTFNGNGSVPLNGIIMYSGIPSDVPPSFALCDGGCYSRATGARISDYACSFAPPTAVIRTPDLRGRFVVGYNPGDADYNSIGDTGGDKGVTLTASQSALPSHNHSVTGTTATDGVHKHWARGSAMWDEKNGDPRGAKTSWDNLNEDLGGGSGPVTRTDGAHAHSINLTAQNTSQANATQSHENRPPYYTLALIIRIR